MDHCVSRKHKGQVAYVHLVVKLKPESMDTVMLTGQDKNIVIQFWGTLSILELEQSPGVPKSNILSCYQAQKQNI